MVLRVSSWKKKTKFFLAGPFFHVLLIKYLSKCPDSKTTPLSWKIPGYEVEVHQWEKHLDEYWRELK